MTYAPLRIYYHFELVERRVKEWTCRLEDHSFENHLAGGGDQLLRHFILELPFFSAIEREREHLKTKLIPDLEAPLQASNVEVSRHIEHTNSSRGVNKVCER